MSAEGQQYLFNNKKVSGKQLKTLAEMILPEVKGGKKLSKNYNSSLLEEINSLRKEIRELKNSKVTPLKENKVIKMYDSDYTALTEMYEDLLAKSQEQAAVIKNYEALNSFTALDESYTKEMEDMFQSFTESMEEIDKVKLNDTFTTSYAKGTDIALNVINENIMPLLDSLFDTKAKILAEMDTNYKVSKAMRSMASKINSINESNSYHQMTPEIPNDIQSSILKLNSLTESAMADNKITKLRSLMENKLKYKKSFGRNEVLKILSEASDLVAFDNNPDYEGSIPKCESFEDRVAKTINSALSGRNKSDISVLPDNDGNLLNRNEIEKFDLPIARDNFNPNTTVKSAIMQLSESLTDIDGNLNIDLCKKAYLYQKVKNPTTMKDFAIPIALVNESDGKLYAHPKLIEFAANMLASDKSMRTYGITSRRELEMLRESLSPYLKKLNIEIPWAIDPNDNFSKINKKKSK